jgi:hypothetical protein
MPSLEEMERVLRQAELRLSSLQGEERSAQAELEKFQKEIQAKGFKNVRELQEANARDERELEEKKAALSIKVAAIQEALNKP